MSPYKSLGFNAEFVVKAWDKHAAESKQKGANHISLKLMKCRVRTDLQCAHLQLVQHAHAKCVISRARGSLRKRRILTGSVRCAHVGSRRHVPHTYLQTSVDRTQPSSRKKPSCSKRSTSCLCAPKCLRMLPKP